MKTAHTPELIRGIVVEFSTMGLPGYDQFEVDGENRTCPAYLSRAQRDYTLRAVNNHAALIQLAEMVAAGNTEFEVLESEARIALAAARKEGAG